MPRRRRRKRSRTASSVQLVQIMGLILALVLIVLFRDEIAGGAGKFFGSWGSEDVKLPQEKKKPAPAKGNAKKAALRAAQPAHGAPVDAGTDAG